MRKTETQDFGFGLEAEFLLMDVKSRAPLWYQDLSFDRLNTMLESIPLTGYENISGLKLEEPHRKAMPYVVEGYHLPDADFKMVDMRPKGIEIRTPFATQLGQVISDYKELYGRMQIGLEGLGYRAAALSHHPTAVQFTGPQNKRRHDYWAWAMEAMTTYGPDVNVSLPSDLSRRLDLVDLDAKINAYAPAMAAFSVSSPFYGGELWKVRGELGQSIRTYRRSLVAPAIEIHPEEDGRLEFKVFEMSPRLEDYRCYFLLFLELLLDEGLKARAPATTRIYDLGSVALRGLSAPEIQPFARELLTRAPQTLSAWGFDPSPLAEFERRLDRQRAPAQDLVDRSLGGESLTSILDSLSRMEGA